MIKISVIIPVFNMEKFLGYCLDSVRKQTLQEIEIIAVNDGSTDHSLELLLEYAKVCSNLILINQKNCGVGNARNRGIQEARGEYIAFMDPDDFYPTEKVLATLYEKAAENQVKICGGSALYCREDAAILYESQYNGLVFREEQLICYAQYQSMYGFTRFLYRREMLIDHGIKFPEYIRYQDPPFFVKAMISAGDFYSIPEYVYCAREVSKIVQYQKAEVIQGILEGCLEIIRLSAGHRLEKLHAEIVRELFGKFEYRIYRYVYEGHEAILSLIEEINQEIDWELAFRGGIEEQKRLMNRKEVIRLVEGAHRKEKEFCGRVREHKSAVIYGAGMVAKELYEYLAAMQSVEIENFVVTDTTSNIREYKGIPVIGIAELKNTEKVLILVAVMEDKMNDILLKLKAAGAGNILPVNYNEFKLYGLGK